MLHSGLRIAHRGYHQVHIENSLEAFRAAYAAGCEMVEFDVQLSRDGVPVIFHDDDCMRLAGRSERLCELDWAEIRQLELRVNTEVQQNFYRIPSLDEFLSEFRSKDFYLEIKIPELKKNAPEYYQRLGKLCAEKVTASQKARRTEPGGNATIGLHDSQGSQVSHTFLASFHLETLRYLSTQKLYPRLAGIFEDYEGFEENCQDPHLTLTYYSVSWEVFTHYLDTQLKFHLSLRFSNILIWNIFGADNFRKAWSMGVAGLVADDVKLLLQN